MNLTSFLANKCFAYLLKCDSGGESRNPRTFNQLKTTNNSLPHFVFPPPWSVEIKLFRNLCNGCGDCLAACSNNILILTKDGCAGVDFSRGGCSFCSACAQNCPQGALRHEPACQPWDIRAFITDNCLMANQVLCRTCVEQCDKGAIISPKTIHNGLKPKIQAEKCNGCGACFASCPVGAIAFENNEQHVKT